MKIQYIIGDATKPMIEGPKIIAHICNDIGAWGKGFVLSLSARWEKPKEQFQKWYFTNNQTFRLGEVQLVKVEKDIWVANIIGQHDIHSHNGIEPIRYDAIERGLQKLSRAAQELNASIHMPRIGCGLAGGNWEKVEPIIQNCLLENNIPVYVYDLAS